MAMVNPHHAISWKRPVGYRMVPIINRAVDRLTLIELQPRSALYNAFFLESPVYRADKKARRRRKRSDGATNVITQVKTIVWYTDIVSNFVAKPIVDEFGRRTWERKTMMELNALAFGTPIEDEVSLKRTERAVRDLCAMGYMDKAEWKKLTANGYRSESGLKWLTDKFWRVLGLLNAVKDERGKRKAAKEAEKAMRLIEALTRTNSHAMRRGCAPNGDLATAPAEAAASPAPLETHPPNTKLSAVAEAALAASWALLSD